MGKERRRRRRRLSNRGEGDRGLDKRNVNEKEREGRSEVK